MITDQARAFLTSPWPELLSFICDPDSTRSHLDHGQVKANYRRGRPGAANAQGWAWAVWTDGLHLESADTWQGWSHRPRTVISWPDLDRLIESHPGHVTQIHSLAAGRGTPRGAGWQWFACPHILTNWGWHPDYYRNEMDDDCYVGGPGGYRDRLHAWAQAIDLAAQLETEPTDLLEWAELLASQAQHG